MIKVNCNEGRVEVRGRDFQHELSAVKSLSAEKEYNGVRKVWDVKMGCLDLQAAMLQRGLHVDVFIAELVDAANKARWAWEENYRFFN